MAELRRILVTGAGGGTGGVGSRVVRQLSAWRIPVRAMVHHDDHRAKALRAVDGVEVVVGDLTNGADVVAALDGCQRLYFGMSVSSDYLQAAATVAAAALDSDGIELLVNMSQMTVSQMTLTSTAESRHQHLHWLAEHMLSWSCLPGHRDPPDGVHGEPVLQHSAAASIQRDGTIRLPFGDGRTSPVATRDVADVVARVLTEPHQHVGRVYELTGATSRAMTAIAAEFSDLLRRPVRYVDVPFDEWLERDLKPLGLSPHLADHLATMARLHKQDRYDRVTSDIADITGHSPSGFDSLVAETPALQHAAA